MNESRRDWILRKLYGTGILNRASPKIALWGLAYKPGTYSLKNAPSLKLIDDLARFSVVTYDPEVQLPHSHQRPSVLQTSSAIECLNGADVLIIMTPWPEFSSYLTQEILAQMNNGIIIDAYGVLSQSEVSPTNYITMGR